jgi:hypothetical protein
VYVDDIVLTGNDDREIQNLKHREGIIYTPYVKKREQLANMLTNRVSSSILHSALSKLGMQDIYASN